MSIEDNGGPAFPAQFWDDRATGMTLRDYFAGQVVTGFIAALPHFKGVEVNGDGIITEAGIAKQAYVFADALLEARKK